MRLERSGSKNGVLVAVPGLLCDCLVTLGAVMTGSVSQACLCFGLIVRPHIGSVPCRVACVHSLPQAQWTIPGNQGPLLLLPASKLVTSLRKKLSVWQKPVLLLGGQLMQKSHVARVTCSCVRLG